MVSICIFGLVFVQNYWHGLDLQCGNAVGFMTWFRRGADGTETLVDITEGGVRPESGAGGVFSVTHDMSHTPLARQACLLVREASVLQLAPVGATDDILVRLVMCGTVSDCVLNESSVWIRQAPSVSSMATVRLRRICMFLTLPDVVELDYDGCLLPNGPLYCSDRRLAAFEDNVKHQHRRSMY